MCTLGLTRDLASRSEKGLTTGSSSARPPKCPRVPGPSDVTFTFAGLRSQWTMPFSCASW